MLTIKSQNKTKVQNYYLSIKEREKFNVNKSANCPTRYILQFPQNAYNIIYFPILLFQLYKKNKIPSSILPTKTQNNTSTSITIYDIYLIIYNIQCKMQRETDQIIQNENAPKQLLITTSDGIFIQQALTQQIYQPEQVFTKVNYILQSPKKKLLILASQTQLVLYSLKQRMLLTGKQKNFQYIHSISLSPAQNYLQVLDKKPQCEGTTYLYTLPQMELSIQYTDKITEYYSKYYFPIIKFTSDDILYFRYCRQFIQQIIVEPPPPEKKLFFINQQNQQISQKKIDQKSQNIVYQKYQNQLYEKYQTKMGNKTSNQTNQQKQQQNLNTNENEKNQKEKTKKKDVLKLIKKNVNKKQFIKIYNYSHILLYQIQCHELQFYQISKISNQYQYFIIIISLNKKKYTKQCKIYTQDYTYNQPIFNKQLQKADQITIKLSPTSNSFLIQYWSYIDLSQKLNTSSWKLQLYNPKTNKMNSIKIENGPIHDFSWHKKGQAFIIMTGTKPASVRMYSKQKILLIQFGNMIQNTIVWGNLGRFVCFASINNPNGEFNIWDLQQRKQIGYYKCGFISSCQWSLDDRKILTTMIDPQSKENNLYKIYNIKCVLLCNIRYQLPELYGATWLNFYEQNFIITRKKKPIPISVEKQPQDVKPEQNEGNIEGNIQQSHPNEEEKKQEESPQKVENNPQKIQDKQQQNCQPTPQQQKIKQKQQIIVLLN